MPRQAAPVTSARDILLNIDVLCTVSPWRAPLRARPQITKNQNRIGLVNRKVFSIHHVANSAQFSQQRLFSMKGA